jgi:uncharacterized RDD family membrane protein YckC
MRMTRRYEAAEPWQRLAAWALDAIAAGIVLTPFNPLLYDRTPGSGLFFALSVPGLVALFVCLVLFDGGMKGATPGKRMVGIRVTDAKIGRAAVRRVGYIVGGLMLYLGWLWILVDGRRQAWHDKLAGTIVVRTR